jgi:hypothetical protein
MSRLEVPLAFRRLSSTGDVLVRAELDLAIKTNRGAWEIVPFVVDPGTEMTTMSAAAAKKRDLPIPKRPVPGVTLHGLEIRSGLLRARIVGMDATEYLFPCFFLGDPNIPLAKPRNLLGLSGVINQVRFTFDGTSSPIAPCGVLVVKKNSRHQRIGSAEVQ